jgi:hypothetical protein
MGSAYTGSSKTKDRGFMLCLTMDRQKLQLCQNPIRFELSLGLIKFPAMFKCTQEHKPGAQPASSLLILKLLQVSAGSCQGGWTEQETGQETGGR